MRCRANPNPNANTNADPNPNADPNGVRLQVTARACSPPLRPGAVLVVVVVVVVVVAVAEGVVDVPPFVPNAWGCSV